MIFLIRKSIKISKVFMYPIRKDENCLSTKGKCFKYYVQFSNILRNTIKVPI